MNPKRGFGRQEENIPSSTIGKNYLLTIGIDQYHHWQRLSNAVKDAKDFSEVLTRQYQFDTEHIYALLDEKATEANIYQALRDMKRRLKPQDNLIVYYSGHGHFDDEFDEGYWIPVNARRDDESNFISNANIVKRINALDTQHTLLIVDSCFSGSLVVRKRNAIPDERFKSRRILASGRHETVSDGKEGENSPFASGLLTYLRQNTAPKLDTTSLIKYVKDYVYGKAKQHPVDGRIQNSADEGGEFVFHLKRDEEAVWLEVSTANTVVEYRNYLMGFPGGKYVAAANRKINALAESDIWDATKINDTELAYEEYISKYSPTGKYITDAQERLAVLKQNRLQRQKAQEEIAARESERSKLNEQYGALVREAEALFKDRKLEQAREKYRKALQIHLSGFAPTQEYLEEQINFCQNNMVFLRHYENGKTALQEENYRLAINYFQQALTINNNAKVEKLINYCQQQLAGGGNTTSYKQQNKRAFTGTAQQQKPKRRIGLWIGVGALVSFFLLLILGALINEGVIDPANENVIQNSSKPDNFNTEGEVQLYGKPPSTADLLIGSWQVNSINVIRNGYAYDATNEDASLLLLIGAVYSFQANGSVTVTNDYGTNYLTYSLADRSIFIQAQGYSTGSVDYIDEKTLQVTLPFTNTFGTHMLQYNLSRY